MRFSTHLSEVALFVILYDSIKNVSKRDFCPRWYRQCHNALMLIKVRCKRLKAWSQHRPLRVPQWNTSGAKGTGITECLLATWNEINVLLRTESKICAFLMSVYSILFFLNFPEPILQLFSSVFSPLTALSTSCSLLLPCGPFAVLSTSVKVDLNSLMPFSKSI